MDTGEVARLLCDLRRAEAEIARLRTALAAATRRGAEAMRARCAAALRADDANVTTVGASYMERAAAIVEAQPTEDGDGR